MIRTAYAMPTYTLGQQVLTSVVNSSDPNEVYAPGDDIWTVDNQTGMELVRFRVDKVREGGVIEMTVVWMSEAIPHE